MGLVRQVPEGQCRKEVDCNMVTPIRKKAPEWVASEKTMRTEMTTPKTVVKGKETRNVAETAQSERK